MKWTVPACLALLALIPAGARAAVPQTFNFPIARAPHALALDPSLRDPAWQTGLVPGGTWENITTRSAAQQQTQAYVLYDDHNLYVAFQVQQSGIPITASQGTNDIGFGIDDFVGIGVDPSGAGTQAYYFETTPLGTRYESANENVRYRPTWQSAATKTATGWSAVMIIPLDVLRIPHGGAQTWRFQFVRAIAANGEHYVWAFDGLMQDGPTGIWPTFADTRWWAAGSGVQIAATTAARPRPRANIYGLESLGRDGNLFAQANGAFAPQSVRHYGIDVSVPVTPTINFVGTLDPDFSNVEVDQQTIAPQEFRRQLAEYRPFFSQGAVFLNATTSGRSLAGAISSGSNFVFFSPDIGPFDRGAKVEGTFGDQSFGALSFRGYDQTTGNTFDDQAFGYEHALPDRSFLYWTDGALAHHSLAGDDATVEGGAEARNLKSGLIGYVDYAFENGSWVPQGHADEVESFVDIHKPNYEVNVGLLNVSPNYNPIDGYTANSDIRGPQGLMDFTGGSSRGIKNWFVFIQADRFEDESGAVHQADAGAAINVTFANKFSVDGIGPTAGELRSYGIPSGPGCTGAIVGASFFTGFPCYRDGTTQAFDLTNVPIGYGDGTPAPVDADYSWGTFGTNDLHLFTLTTTREIGHKLTLGLEYDGTYERAFSDSILDSQWLRRASIGYNLSSESTFTLSLRSINGYGGFAPAVGTNLGLAYQQRFLNGDELYINYGTPASPTTLNRLIVKFIFHTGADTGT
jgi:hypothetical protein